MNAVARNGHGAQGEEPLADEDRAREALLMGMRLREGVDLRRIASESGITISQLVDDRAVARLMEIGLMDRQESHIQVTPAGMLLLDAILPEIVTI